LAGGTVIYNPQYDQGLVRFDILHACRTGSHDHYTGLYDWRHASSNADGTEKYLKNIRQGDVVATYKNGQLTESKVVNWVNNGLDKVFTIKTTSGIKVKANQRHPFLVNENGVKKWIRLKDLRQGYEIYRVNGENGKAKHAKQMDATNLLYAEDTVHITTIRSGGQMVSGRHLPPNNTRQARNQNLKNVMESLRRFITKCLRHKMVVALFANVLQINPTIHPPGETCCVLTTATTLEKSEDFSATTATYSLNELPPPMFSKKLSNTSDFILEKIESITYAGIEEVFDVQIAETENFIANQLVSHNTRWHEDDLIGYLLREKKSDGWFNIRIPAIAEEYQNKETGLIEPDVMGRKIGQALCPQRYDEKALSRIRMNMSPMMWNALFQQRPAPMEGTIFLRKNWKYYKAQPKCRFIVQSWDTASKQKSKGSDTAFSVCQTWGISEEGAVLLSQWRDRVEFPQLVQQEKIQFLKWRPNVVVIEDRDSGQALIQTINQDTTMIQPIIPFYPDMDKVIRAQAVSPWHEAGRVFVPDPTVEGNQWVADFIDTCATFPNALYKDEIDCMSQALTYIMTMAMGGRVMSAGRRKSSEILTQFRRLM